MIKNILILLLFVLMCSSKPNKFDSPSTFDFKISDGIYNSYNSETGLFKRCYSNGTKLYEIPLSNDEKKIIHNFCKEIHFQKFPSEFKIDWNSSDTITIITPSFHTSIEICENNSCKKVILDLIDLTNPINDREKALQYRMLYDKIWQMIENKEEYMSIPDSDCFYL